jgi:hypothetical protein
MSHSARETDDDSFREAQEGDYEPESRLHDPDDLPVGEVEHTQILHDDDRPVLLDQDDDDI